MPKTCYAVGGIVRAYCDAGKGVLGLEAPELIFRLEQTLGYLAFLMFSVLHSIKEKSQQYILNSDKLKDWVG